MTYYTHVPLLKTLQELNNNQRSIILSHLDNTACESIYGCIKKILKTNNKVHKNKSSFTSIRSKLKNDKEILRCLSSKCYSKRANVKKRKKLAQVGGSVGFIISLALPIILDLIKNNLTKKNKK